MIERRISEISLEKSVSLNLTQMLSLALSELPIAHYNRANLFVHIFSQVSLAKLLIED